MFFTRNSHYLATATGSYGVLFHDDLHLLHSVLSHDDLHLYIGFHHMSFFTLYIEFCFMSFFTRTSSFYHFILSVHLCFFTRNSHYLAYAAGFLWFLLFTSSSRWYFKVKAHKNLSHQFIGFYTETDP